MPINNPMPVSLLNNNEELQIVREKINDNFQQLKDSIGLYVSTSNLTLSSINNFDSFLDVRNKINYNNLAIYQFLLQFET